MLGIEAFDTFDRQLALAEGISAPVDVDVAVGCSWARLQSMLHRRTYAVEKYFAVIVKFLS